jgi:hypothetical protein
VLVAGNTRLRARSHAVVRLRYAATVAASVTVTIRRGSRTVSTSATDAVAGRNQLRLRAPRKAGRYRVTLANGTATDSVRLTVAAR